MRRFGVVSALLAFVLVGISCSPAISNRTSDTPEELVVIVDMPTVIGQSQRAATNTLLNVGFVVEEQFAPGPSGESEAGQVFGQQPEAGTKLELGSIVTIFVTEGEAEASAPAGDSPVGEGDPSGEPIEPTTTLGSDAIWPEPLEQAGPEAVAQRFASEVLGWAEPLLTVGPEAAPDGPTWVTIANITGFSVNLQVIPFGDSGWGVIQIGEAISAGVAERPEGGTAFQIIQIPDAARVVVHVADQSGKTRAWQADLTNHVEPRSIAVPDVEIEDLATILVLYNDQMGNTLAVNGSQYGVG